MQIPEMDVTAYDTPAKRKPRAARREPEPKTHEVVALVDVGQRRRMRKPPMEKVSIYVPREMLNQMVAEAQRLERTLSWTFVAAWRAQWRKT